MRTPSSTPNYIDSAIELLRHPALRPTPEQLAQLFDALAIPAARVLMNPTLTPIEVELDEVGPVLVGYEWEPGEDAVYDVESPWCGPGTDESVTVLEVWCNGVDIGAGLKESAYQQLVEAVTAARGKQAQRDRDDAEADRIEAIELELQS